MLAFDVASAVGILLAWVGWGSLLDKTLVRDPSTDWGQKAAWGMTLLVSIGGLLEVTCTISRPLVLAILVIGWGLWGFDVARRGSWPRLDSKRWARHRLAAVLVIAVCGLVFLRLVASASSHRVNIHDDQHAYLVFPARMLDAGCMGEDPFNHRRLVSSLGGKSWLDTFTMSVGTPYNLHLTDAGLGLLLVMGLLLGRLRRREVAALPAAGLLLFAVVIPPPQVNMSALLLGTALLLSLFRMLDHPWPEKQRRGAVVLLIALTAAAAVSLKNQLLPPVALTLAFHYVVSFHRAESKRRVVGEAAGCAALAGLLLLPWMRSLLSSSGTLFYGLAGTGVARYDLTADFRTPAGTLELVGVAVTNRDFLALMVLSGLIFFRQRRTTAGGGPALALASGTGLAAIVVTVVTTVPGRTLEIAAHRYCFPFLLAGILALLSVAAESAGGPLRRRITIGVAALLVLVYVPGMAREFTRSASAVYSAVREGPRFSPDEVRSLQEAVPAGETLLARLEAPFLLDFGRNPVYVVDHPGMVSPDPGMPTFAGSEELASYLLALPVRYLAFSYRTEANYSEDRFGGRLEPPTHPTLEAVAAHVFDFNDNLRQLAQSRRRIYDDGDRLVLDLTQPAASED